MKLIAVTGPQGSGKSTVLSQLPYHVIARKTSRSILADWGVTLAQVNNDRALTIKFQDEILSRKQADEREATNQYDVVFTERSYIDLFVYSLVALGKDNEYSTWLDEYYHRCMEAQKVYTDVIYVQGGHFTPVDDGVRAINQHYAEMVDVMMSLYATRCCTQPIHRCTSADIPTRVQLFMQVAQGA